MNEKSTGIEFNFSRFMDDVNFISSSQYGWKKRDVIRKMKDGLIKYRGHVYIRENQEKICSLFEKLLFKSNSREKQDIGLELLSLAGHAIGLRARNYFYFLFNRMEKSLKDKKYPVSTILYLMVINQYLKKIPPAEKPNFVGDVRTILVETVEVMERLNNVGQFKVALAIVQKINKEHNSLIVPVFKNLVDLVLGWYLSPNTPSNIRFKIIEFFTTLSQLWSINEKFTSQLIHKLLDDVVVSQKRRVLVIYLSCLSVIIHQSRIKEEAPSFITKLITCGHVNHGTIFSGKSSIQQHSECIQASLGLIEKENAQRVVSQIVEFYSNRLRDVKTNEGKFIVLGVLTELLEEKKEVDIVLERSLLYNINKLISFSNRVKKSLMKYPNQFYEYLLSKELHIKEVVLFLMTSTISRYSRVFQKNFFVLKFNLNVVIKAIQKSEESIKKQICEAVLSTHAQWGGLFKAAPEPLHNLFCEIKPKYALKHASSLGFIVSYKPKKKTLVVVLNCILEVLELLSETEIDEIASDIKSNLEPLLSFDSGDIREKYLMIMRKFSSDESYTKEIIGNAITELSQQSSDRIANGENLLLDFSRELIKRKSWNDFVLWRRKRVEENDFTTLLSSKHFKEMMEVLKNRKIFKKVVLPIFKEIQRDNRKVKRMDVLKVNYNQLEKWMVTSMVKFCMKNNMKTHLGDANVTFRTFKEMGGELWIDRTDKSKFFVLFLSKLEHEIHSLWMGKLDEEYNEIQKSFYIQNRGVITKWFQKLRKVIFKNSVNSNLSASIFRNGLELMNDTARVILSRKDNVQKVVSLFIELEDIIVSGCDKLVLTEDYDIIEGFEIWINDFKKKLLTELKRRNQKNSPDVEGRTTVLRREITPKDLEELDLKFVSLLRVIKGFRQESAGNLEFAHEHYRKVLQAKQMNDSAISRTTEIILVDHTIKCFTQLSDFEGLINFEKQFGEVCGIKNSKFAFPKFLEGFEKNFETKSKTIDESSLDSFSKNVFLLHNSFQSKNMENSSFYIKSMKKNISSSLRMLERSLTYQEAFRVLSQAFNIKYIASNFLLDEKKQINFFNHVNSEFFEGKYQFEFLGNFLRVMKLISKDITNFESFEQEVISNQQNISRMNYNFKTSDRLLEQIKEPLFKKYRTARTLETQLQIPKALETYSSMFLNPDSIKTKNIFHAKSLLRLHAYSEMDPLKSEQIATFFPIKQEEVSEYLLRKAVELSPKGKEKKALIVYHDWCLRKCNNILKTMENGNFELVHEEEKAIREICEESNGKLNIEIVKNTFSEFIKCALSQYKGSKMSILKNLIKEENLSEKVFIVWKDFLERKLLGFNTKGIENAFQVIKNFSLRKDEKIRITLTMLEYFYKFGEEHQNKILKWIDESNPDVWNEIIPQLFSLLGNEQNYFVRKIIQKIGCEQPENIAFPVVVGSRSKKNHKFRIQHKDILESFKNKEKEVKFQIFKKVELFVDSLNKIIKLPEDVVLHNFPTIQKKYKEGMEKFISERNQLEKIGEPSEVSLEKIYKKKLGDVIVIIDSSIKFIGNEGETKHEKEFQETIGIDLRNLLESIKNPKELRNVNTEYLKDQFQILFEKLKKIHKKGFLNLGDISPNLNKLSNDGFPIPGFYVKSNYNSREGLPIIQKFEDNVEVLTSKTKPKKIFLIGSDQKKYSFLLKGKEDLHLDERVMQLLRFINFNLKRDKKSRVKDLIARDYVVVPLGDDCGILQWVEGTTSVLEMQREWYRKKVNEKNHKLTRNTKRDRNENTNSENNKSIVNIEKSSTFRPVEIFLRKFVPLLKQNGINTTEQPYPLDLCKKAVQEIIPRFPRMILRDELYVSSNDLDEWWFKLRRFNHTYAVMAMIGYVIGLGDRHLDNILLDKFKGEVVHIDYNVCFDKGLKLKIPEVVPFRLTPVISSAFGVAGVSGMFRKGCELTLGVLKERKKTLVKLLDAFVYDPLFDWRGQRHDDEFSEMTTKVSANYFGNLLKEGVENVTEISEKIVGECKDIEKYGREYNDQLDQKKVEFKNIENVRKIKKDIIGKKTEISSKISQCRKMMDKLENVYSLIENKNLKELKTYKKGYKKIVNEITLTLDKLRNKEFVGGLNKHCKLNRELLDKPNLTFVLNKVIKKTNDPRLVEIKEIHREFLKCIKFRDEKLKLLMGGIFKINKILKEKDNLCFLKDTRVMKWKILIERILEKKTNGKKLDLLFAVLKNMGKEEEFEEEKEDFIFENLMDDIVGFKKACKMLKKIHKKYSELENSIMKDLKWLSNFPTIGKTQNEGNVKPKKIRSSMNKRKDTFMRSFKQEETLLKIIQDLIKIKKFKDQSNKQIIEYQMNLELVTKNYIDMRKKEIRMFEEYRFYKKKLDELIYEEKFGISQYPILEKKEKKFMEMVRTCFFSIKVEAKRKFQKLSNDDINNFFKNLEQVTEILENLKKITRGYNVWSSFFEESLRKINSIREKIKNLNNSIQEELDNKEVRGKVDFEFSKPVLKCEIILRQILEKSENLRQQFMNGELENVKKLDEEQEQLGYIHAKNVLKRVSKRLDDEQPLKDTVRNLIMEATNWDNLCKMYVGWCPFL